VREYRALEEEYGVRKDGILKRPFFPLLLYNPA